MSQILLAVSILALLFGTSCKKDNQCPQLPPITKTGACTFGCRVNGEVWLPGKKSNGTIDDIEGGIKGRWNLDGSRDTISYDFLLFGYGKNNSSFQVYLSEINQTGAYPVNFSTMMWPAMVQPKSYLFFNDGSRGFQTDFRNTGSVTVTRYDKTNQIFSGQFEFKVFNSNGLDSAVVTDGRFDIDMKKIN